MTQLTEDDFIALLVKCGEVMTKDNETTWRTIWQHRDDMDDFLGKNDHKLTGNARTLIDGEVVTYEQILAEGQRSTPQFNEWHDIFDLQSVCNKLGMSELEKWCVLGNRFHVLDFKNDIPERGVSINGIGLESDDVTVRIHWKDLKEVIENVTWLVHKQEGFGYREVVPVIETKEQLITLMSTWQNKR